MSSVAWIGLGGALGAVSRYLMALWVNGWWDRSFPLATLLINILGSLLMGVVVVVLVERLQLGPEFRAALMTGFLGGFTTFSTFSLESYNLLAQGELTSALLYLLASVILCVLALALGIWLARLI